MKNKPEFITTWKFFWLIVFLGAISFACFFWSLKQVIGAFK